MRRALVAIALTVVTAATLLEPAASAPVGEPNRPFPQHVDYGADTHRPDELPQPRLDRDVRRFYRYWKAQYLVQDGVDGEGRPLYRISFGSTEPDRTVSEGQGYGMLTVAYMAGADPAAQPIFDGLWRWARQYPSSIDPALMAWEVPPGDGDSAFDGDADMAYALLLADEQWGSDGAVNYRRDARRLLRGILRSTIGDDTLLPLLGDWVDASDDDEFDQTTWRSSDCMPGHFDAFARLTGRRVWRKVANRCVRQLDALQRVHAPASGLLPDFIVDADSGPVPAPPGFLEGDTDGSYSYNAFRDPWRIGVDALLSGRPRSQIVAARLADWAASEGAGDPANLGAGYRLDGTPTPGTDYFTSVVAAPLAVATMTTPEHDEWLDVLYRSIRNRREDYYEDSVTMLCLIVLSGNWWAP